jgi:hypothetical protein
VALATFMKSRRLMSLLMFTASFYSDVFGNLTRINPGFPFHSGGHRAQFAPFRDGKTIV